VKKDGVVQRLEVNNVVTGSDVLSSDHLSNKHATLIDTAQNVERVVLHLHQPITVIEIDVFRCLHKDVLLIVNVSLNVQNLMRLGDLGHCINQLHVFNRHELNECFVLDHDETSVSLDTEDVALVGQ
jgi:hypothetical protein